MWVVLGSLLIVFLFTVGYIAEKKSNIVAETAVPTAQQVKSILEQRQVFVFPAVNKSNPAQASDLPDGLKFLIMDNASDFKVGKINFQDGKAGYQVSYLFKKNILDTFLDLKNQFIKQQSGWVVANAERANLSAILEEQNADYKVRIVETFLETEQKTLVEILMLTLK